MIKEDLLKYIKERKVIKKSETQTFKISKNDIKEICKEFNWSAGQKEMDGEPVIYFKDESGNEITDFSNYSLDDGYREIFMLFQCQEDCDKYRDLFPGMKGVEIGPKTTNATINSMDDCRVFNTKRVTAPNQKTVSHSDLIMDNFAQWKEMPEYYFNFTHDIYAKFPVKYKVSEFPSEKLQELFDQSVTERTDSVWFPKKEKNEFNYYRVLGGDENPEFPIYIVSKGRSKEFYYHTSRSVSIMGVHHYICVEPQEVEDYEKSKINESKYCHILPMDMKYKQLYNTLGDLGNSTATGAGAARNFCADHARANGFKWCWILDDNTEAFYRYWRGRRFIAFTPEVFRSVERFVVRYKNIGLAGLNYHMFVINQDERPPFITNSKIYSYGLWNLDCPMVAQEGRYNEDVIQSLKILDSGYWTTVQFNLYLARKLRTQILKGGNTTEIYGKQYGGTFTKSQMLVERFPQYAKLVWKFDRWHHTVDYSGFKQKLILKDEYKYLMDKDYNEINEHGAYIVKIDPKYHLNQEYDNKEFLEKVYPRGCPEDITRCNKFLLQDRNSIELRNFWSDETPGKNEMIINITNKVNNQKNEMLENPLFDDVVEQKVEIVEEKEDVFDNIAEINADVEANIRQNSDEFNIDNL